MKNLVLPALVTMLTLTGQSASAQPGSGGPTPDPAPTSTPIDGGASLVLAGGMGYALKRLRNRRS